MPSLEFVLPHWLYWIGLAVFPLVAMALVYREKRQGLPPRVSYPLAYMLWLFGGFVGLHRFYLGSRLGVLYLPLFIAILVGNSIGTDVRLAVSETRNDILKSEFLHERAVQRSGPESEAANQAMRELERARSAHQAASERLERVDAVTAGIAGVAGGGLLIDALLIPSLVRRRRRRESGSSTVAVDATGTAGEGEEVVPPLPASLPGRFAWVVDRVSGVTGHFVAYWSVIAVFIYYYEVIARYVFNSPTNWAHESMFLMFGMQYLIAGAFALREDAHVRVDIVYQYLPRKVQAGVDVVTSLFFFLFTGALLVTGWTFFSDSFAVWEVSFTEWAIQYWVVKLALPVGAALLLLQGIAKLIRDLSVLTGRAGESS